MPADACSSLILLSILSTSTCELLPTFSCSPTPWAWNDPSVDASIQSQIKNHTASSQEFKKPCVSFTISPGLVLPYLGVTASLTASLPFARQMAIKVIDSISGPQEFNQKLDIEWLLFDIADGTALTFWFTWMRGMRGDYNEGALPGERPWNSWTSGFCQTARGSDEIGPRESTAISCFSAEATLFRSHGPTVGSSSRPWESRCSLE